MDLAIADLLEHVGLRRERLIDRGDQRPVIRDDREPTRINNLLRRALTGDDALEDLSGELVGECSCVDEPLQSRDIDRRNEVARFAVLRVRDPGDLTGPPLARCCRRCTRGNRGLDLGQDAAIGDILELEVGEAPLRLEPAPTRSRCLGKRRTKLLDQLS